MMKRHASVGNRLLAALPPADLGLLAPYLQQVSLKQDAVLVRSGDRNEQIYFPHSGTISFMLDMPNGQTVATSVIGHEGAVGMLSVLGPSRSPTTAVVRVAGIASQISASRFHAAFGQSSDGDVLPLTQEALSQLLGVRRTTVTHVVRKLRVSGAIRSDRRGLIEIDRPRLEEVACECYEVMRRRIDQIFPTETMKPRVQAAPVREIPRDRDPFLAK
jgi:CRP-like cAMP-binding protein